MPSKKQNPKWKKYKCVDKTEDQLLTDLYESCREGRDDVVKLLIRDGNVDVNQISKEEQLCQGLSALHATARHNQLSCMKVLLENGANSNIEDAFGFRAIHDAALYGYVGCLKELLAHGAHAKGVSNEDLSHVTPLFYAVQQNHLNCVELLKETGEESDYLLWDVSSKRGNVSVTDITNHENIRKSSLTRWLNNSAVSGHTRYLDRVREVIARKFKTKEALHSLHSAVQHGHTEYLQKLIDHDIDVNLKSKTNDTTALHLAARYGHCECIKLLIEVGADKEALTVDNYTPLHIAIRQGPFESVITLLDHDVDVNSKGGDHDDTPLHMCLKLCVDENVMTGILKHQPDLTITNKNNKKPTDIKSDFEILNEILLQYVRN